MNNFGVVISNYQFLAVQADAAGSSPVVLGGTLMQSRRRYSLFLSDISPSIWIELKSTFARSGVIGARR
jgi:hypothetical protein